MGLVVVISIAVLAKAPHQISGAGPGGDGRAKRLRTSKLDVINDGRRDGGENAFYVAVLAIREAEGTHPDACARARFALRDAAQLINNMYRRNLEGAVVPSDSSSQATSEGAAVGSDAGAVRGHA